MALTTYPITGDLKDALGGDSLIGEVTLTPYGSHDARVDGANALLGAISYDLDKTEAEGGLPATLDLTAGAWIITIRAKGRVQGEQQFKTIQHVIDHQAATTWGAIVSGAVSSPPMTPTLVQQAQDAATAAEASATTASADAAAADQARADAEAAAATATAPTDSMVASLAADPASATGAELRETYGPDAAPMQAAFVGKVTGLVAGDSTPATKAANAAILAAALTPNSSAFIPAGDYYTDEIAVGGPIDIRGEDITTTLRNNTGAVWSVSGNQFNVSTLTLRGEGNHTIRQAGPIDQGHWDRVRLYQTSDGYSIWDNPGHAFVDMRFSNLLSWHTQTATVPSWKMVAPGGTINANKWENFRQQFTGNYAFWVESTDANAHLDNEWIKPTWEVCTGGYIRLISCRDYFIDGGGSYDMQIGTPTKLQRHGIYITANASAASSVGKIRGHRRYDSTTPEAGIFDIKLPASNKGDGTILEDCRNISSAAPLLVDLDGNVVMVLQTSGAASTFTTYSNTAGMQLWGKDGITLPATQAFKIGANALAKGFATNVALDPGTVPANGHLDVALTVAGAAAGDACTVSTGSTLDAGLGIVGAWATAGSVTFRLHNSTGAPIDAAARTWRVAVQRP